MLSETVFEFAVNIINLDKNGNFHDRLNFIVRQGDLFRYCYFFLGVAVSCENEFSKTLKLVTVFTTDATCMLFARQHEKKCHF